MFCPDVSPSWQLRNIGAVLVADVLRLTKENVVHLGQGADVKEKDILLSANEGDFRWAMKKSGPAQLGGESRRSPGKVGCSRIREARVERVGFYSRRAFCCSIAT